MHMHISDDSTCVIGGSHVLVRCVCDSLQPPEQLRQHLEGVDPERASALIFPTRGERSLADEMDGGDLDGDEYALIWNESVVAAFPEEHSPAWNESEQQLLLQSTAKPAQQTPSSEGSRRDATAWHMVRTRHGQAAKGRFANQWLLVAESHGAKDRRARKLAYMYPAALDAAKAGSGADTIPEDCQLAAYPSHLAAHFPHRKQDKFTCTRDTCLARLGALDLTSQMPDCQLPDDWFGLVHPSYKPNGTPSPRLLEMASRWEERYKECRAELSSLAGTGWDDPQRLRHLNAVYEKYRAMLLEGHSLEAIRW